MTTTHDEQVEQVQTSRFKPLKNGVFFVHFRLFSATVDQENGSNINYELIQHSGATFYVNCQDSQVTFSYSACSPMDRFNKKLGRTISTTRYQKGTNVYNANDIFRRDKFTYGALLENLTAFLSSTLIESIKIQAKRRNIHDGRLLEYISNHLESHMTPTTFHQAIRDLEDSGIEYFISPYRLSTFSDHERLTAVSNSPTFIRPMYFSTLREIFSGF